MLNTDLLRDHRNWRPDILESGPFTSGGHAVPAFQLPVIVRMFRLLSDNDPTM